MDAGGALGHVERLADLPIAAAVGEQRQHLALAARETEPVRRVIGAVHPVETDPRAGLWWARDVVAFEIVDWQKTYGAALATPDGAADGARRGSGWYGERCISCHRMRGVGGERGPDLTTVAARIRPAPFAALLEKHPGWTGTGGDPPGEEAASEVWAFLRAVAAAGPGTPPESFTAERASGR